MTRYVLRRLGILVVSLLVALVVVFALLRILPGDPANALLAANATPDQVEAARRAVGSDLPLAQQFATWLGQMLRFDLGTSFTSGLPVLPDLAQRLVVTVPLTLIAFVVAVVLASVVGFVAAAGPTAGTACCCPASPSSASPSRCSGSASCSCRSCRCSGDCCRRAGSPATTGRTRVTPSSPSPCRSSPSRSS